MLAVAAVAVMALPLASAAPWFQAAENDFHHLFKRAPGDAAPNPDSPDFASHYPPQYQIANVTLPQAWVDKYNSVKDKLPSKEKNPVSLGKDGAISYPNNLDPNSPDICSFTAGCHTDDDYFLAPDGTFVLTFDDGPTDASPALYDFLQQNKITKQATHFMIGGNIAAAPKQMQAAFNGGGHIAVHTWSHHMTTALSDEDVMGELGWTMQVIADLTGGRIPAYWRPPYGDVDNRVRAIAKHVFGMETILWNRDTNDWKIGNSPENTIDSTKQIMQGWFTGNKTPGILALEHELNKDCVDVFISEYPKAAENGWTVKSVPDAYGLKWYQNADTNEGQVVQMTLAKDISTNLNMSASIESPTSSGASSSAASQTDSSAKADSTNKADSAAAGSGSKNTSSGATRRLAVPGATLLVAALAFVAL